MAKAMKLLYANNAHAVIVVFCWTGNGLLVLSFLNWIVRREREVAFFFVEFIL